MKSEIGPDFINHLCFNGFLTKPKENWMLRSIVPPVAIPLGCERRDITYVVTKSLTDDRLNQNFERLS